MYYFCYGLISRRIRSYHHDNPPALVIEILDNLEASYREDEEEAMAIANLLLQSGLNSGRFNNSWETAYNLLADRQEFARLHDYLKSAATSGGLLEQISRGSYCLGTVLYKTVEVLFYVPIIIVFLLVSGIYMLLYKSYNGLVWYLTIR